MGAPKGGPHPVGLLPQSGGPLHPGKCQRARAGQQRGGPQHVLCALHWRGGHHAGCWHCAESGLLPSSSRRSAFFTLLPAVVSLPVFGSHRDDVCRVFILDMSIVTPQLLDKQLLHCKLVLWVANAHTLFVIPATV